MLSLAGSLLGLFSRLLLCILSAVRYFWVLLPFILQKQALNPSLSSDGMSPAFSHHSHGHSVFHVHGQLPLVPWQALPVAENGTSSLFSNGSFSEGDVLCLFSRQTQWDPPTWDSPGDDASLEHEAEMDLGTPTYDENPMKVSMESTREAHCQHLGGPHG